MTRPMLWTGFAALIVALLLYRQAVIAAVDAYGFLAPAVIVSACIGLSYLIQGRESRY